MTQWRPTGLHNSALELAIDPVDHETFFADYWGQRPLSVPRNEGDRYARLLTVADVENLVSSGLLRHPAFRLVKEGASLAVTDYTLNVPSELDRCGGVVDIARATTQFAQGSTIVLQGLHHWWRPLSIYCRGLEAQLGHPVQANAYYSPRSAQGLPVHHDTHDVLVLQLYGQKRWFIYKPAIELPLQSQVYSPELRERGEPVADLTLSPGHTIYLPRGWLHEAATAEAESLHLTIGILTYTWMDALRAALDSCGEDVEFRRTVPSNGEHHVDLLERLAYQLSSERIAQRMRDRFIGTRRSILHGQLRQVREAAHLSTDARVRRRSTVIAEAIEQDGRLTLKFEGKAIRIPPQAYVAAQYCVSTPGSFRVSDLPGRLNDEGRLVLIRRLILEGFLEIVGITEPQ
jgi:ribosomal protein L16 Arg81 hydroxylase